MTSEHKLDTGYILLDSSGDFPSQAYRVILYQWLCILKAKGVPKHHVLAWAEIVDGVTVLAPRSSPTGPCLTIPLGWEDRVHLGGSILDFSVTIQSTLKEWSEDAEIHRIVIILIGRGTEMGLRAPDGRITPSGLGFALRSCREKPVLMILDFCDSAFFAEQLAADSEENGVKCPVFFLSSGRSSSYKTAIVLFGNSDVEQGVAPGTTDLRYARYSTMFHRPLLDLVAHSPGEAALQDVLLVG
jgi:hypothetical protein